MKKQIEPEKFYTPKDIVKLGIIKGNNLDVQKQMLLRFIRQKRIEAINLGGDKKPRYIITGENLLKYCDSQIKTKDYEKK